MKALDAAEAGRRLSALPDWKREGGQIVRSYAFEDYYETMAFVNAVAWLAHRRDHHPDLLVTYDRCRVAWSTHSVGGLSELDFDCAAHCDALFGR